MRIAARIGSGSSLSQPSLIATASTVASKPCSTRSWNCFEVLNKAAVGGLPPTTRLMATARACSLPATAVSSHTPPALLYASARRAHRRGFTARRPPVHHLRARRRGVREHAHEEGNSDCR